MTNFTHGTNKRIILSPTLLIFALLLCTGLLVSCDKSIADYLDEKLIEQDFVLVHDAIVDGPDYSGAAYRLYAPKDRTVLQDGKTYVTATDIKCFLWRKCIFLAVNNNVTNALTAIYNAKFAVVKEVFLLNVLVNIESEFPEILQLQSLLYWHCTTKDKAVVV